MQRFFTQFDYRIVAAVHRLPHWLRPAMEFFTLIGQPVVVGVVLGGFALTYWLRGQRQASYPFIAAVFGLGISNFLKLLFHRTRPDTYVPRLVRSYSFPSGHAAATSIGYGLLAYLAFKNLPAPWGPVVGCALIAVILLVGLSRLFLGAHYPTDVLGGWALGLIVDFIIIRAFKL